jgi:NTE family protein
MRTVAIACQGGGSHTAFTGGALQRLLADGNHRVVAHGMGRVVAHGMGKS